MVRNLNNPQYEEREKQRIYNKDYYQKNKDRLKLYAKIYNTLHKEKNLEYLREYYENITKVKREGWVKAMLIPKSTRYKPPRKGCFDKGIRVTGFEKKTTLVTVSFQ
tara:strand:+ start:8439 stop:8759 length:321 start_codon:yes stop_codon:yes gene_type:complete